LEVAERERSVGAAMNDSPVDYQNRDVTEPQRDKVAPEATDEVSYPDFDNVAEYARDAVSFLINAELVNGKSGNIAPTDYTTRAEVAVLIKRILDYIAK
ncbi:MAG: S-layer homology domain-containing protein, partial [Oscillospiraceae bacterium]|nr:S-layer homology domain-containing protein [Oscillospiraceae bacterium]